MLYTHRYLTVFCFNSPQHERIWHRRLRSPTWSELSLHFRLNSNVKASLSTSWSNSYQKSCVVFYNAS